MSAQTSEMYVRETDAVIGVTVLDPKPYPARVVLYTRCHSQDRGLHLFLSPESARETAARLLARADEVDALTAGQA